MGANQSRPSDAAINEKLIERLQALHMKEEQRSTSEKDGFVVVAGEARESAKVSSS
jgi:bleomycin hydrolase